MTKLLLIDDDPMVLKDLAKTLKSRGADVITASGVDEIEAALGTGEVRRVISDGLDGKWKEARDLVSQRAEFVLLSSNQDFINEAREKGEKAFDKMATNQQARSEMFAYLIS